MNVTKLCLMGAVCLGVTGNVLANNVILSTTKPAEISYHVARVNRDGHPVFDELKTMKLDHSTTIACDLNGYQRSGIVIVSVNGHVLPDHINQFNQPKNCTMTTDAAHPAGALEFTVTEHSIKCATNGGVFG